MQKVLYGCLSPYGSHWGSGKGVRLQGTVTYSGRRAPEMEPLSLREPGGIKHGSGDGHLFPWRPHWGTLEEGSYARGAIGNLGKGVCLPGTLRIS